MIVLVLMVVIFLLVNFVGNFMWFGVSSWCDDCEEGVGGVFVIIGLIFLIILVFLVVIMVQMVLLWQWEYQVDVGVVELIWNFQGMISVLW